MVYKTIVVLYTYLATFIECILSSYSVDLNKPIYRNIAKNIQNNADTSNDLDIQLTPLMYPTFHLSNYIIKSTT